jgi:hypothetical protein
MPQVRPPTAQDDEQDDESAAGPVSKRAPDRSSLLWEEWLDARFAALAIVPRDTAIHEIDSRTAVQKAPQPSPTIHVTIGRVEVRAATPVTSAPCKPAAQSPVMSLEDYMRQRADGGRR